jgi:hypothetical protein
MYSHQNFGYFFDLTHEARSEALFALPTVEASFNYTVEGTIVQSRQLIMIIAAALIHHEPASVSKEALERGGT